MKKALSLILAIILVLGMFAGCSSNKNDPTEGTKPNENGQTSLHGSTMTITQLKQKYGETD